MRKRKNKTVAWAEFDDALNSARSGFSDLSSVEIEALVDEALSNLRKPKKEYESNY